NRGPAAPLSSAGSRWRSTPPAGPSPRRRRCRRRAIAWCRQPAERRGREEQARQECGSCSAPSSARKGGLASHDGQRHGTAEGVGDAQLKAPGAGPVVGLLVLAHLDEDLVAAGLEDAATDVLIHARAVVILLALEALLAVGVDAHGVVALRPQLERALRRRFHDGPRVADDALLLAVNVVEIDDAHRSLAGVLGPAYGLVVLALVRG